MLEVGEGYAQPLSQSDIDIHSLPRSASDIEVRKQPRPSRCTSIFFFPFFSWLSKNVLLFLSHLSDISTTASFYFGRRGWGGVVVKKTFHVPQGQIPRHSSEFGFLFPEMSWISRSTCFSPNPCKRKRLHEKTFGRNITHLIMLTWLIILINPVIVLLCLNSQKGVKSWRQHISSVQCRTQTCRPTHLVARHHHINQP